MAKLVLFIFSYLQPPYNTFTFSLVGDETSKEFFQINGVTGEVSVKKDLMLDPEVKTTYYVSSLYNHMGFFCRICYVFKQKVKFNCRNEQIMYTHVLCCFKLDKCMLCAFVLCGVFREWSHTCLYYILFDLHLRMFDVTFKNV
jgi:hypothetical protein